MRVLMLTQAIDAADPLLGFVVSWVRALAHRVSSLDVVCLRSTAPTLPSHVAVWPIGSRNEGSRLHRFLEYERRVLGLIASADVVLAHMVPRYVWASAPAAMLHHRPIVLWYVHRANSLELRVATRLSRFVATAVPGSFPLQTPKLRVLGHGVDNDAFAPAAVLPSSPLVVSVGRLMPVKHQATLLRALAILRNAHPDVRAVFVGGVPDGESESYQRSLLELARTLQIADHVTFEGPLAPAAVCDVYRRATVAVNLSPMGLFDKAALESMMSGIPTVVASPSFDELIGANTWLRIDSPEDHDGLATALDRALSLTLQERTELTAAIRARAVDAHGLGAFMDRLVGVLHEAVDGRS